MSMLQHLPLSRKLAFSFVTIIAISGTASAVSYYNNEIARDAAGWNDHTFRVMEKISAGRIAMVNQETGLRGFLISGDENFLEPYDAGRIAVGQAIDAVAQLTSDNARQQARVQDLRGEIARWQTEIAGREIEAARAGNMDAARRMEASGVGKASMDRIRNILSEMDGEESSLLSKRAELADTSSETARLMIILGGLASVVAAAAMAFWMSRLVTKPIVSVTGVMRELAEGNLSVEVTGADRRDEIGGMARTVQVFKDAAVQNKRLEAEAEAARAAELARLEREAAAERVKAQDLAAFVAGIEGGFARLSAGDLTARMDEAVAPEFEPIREQFNGSVG
ncbi:CHASE3 domain-containing protein, partial [uncultured Aureimonas sp.]|uniref:CHASE3 domain-containing protein n=1 Tax=uncultured Aureimonas sp. TaxID=1604662 RepID=UPI0025DF8C37